MIVSRFMWTLHTANEEHWVPIETVASFKRMREFKEALGIEGILEVLNDSELLEVDDSKTKVRRKTEVKEPADPFDRSIYAVSQIKPAELIFHCSIRL